LLLGIVPAGGIVVGMGEGREEKERQVSASFFEKKEAKKLLFMAGVGAGVAQARTTSFF
jgi:hypothetical protein